MSEQDKLLEQIKQQLDDSAEYLDASTQSRLTQIRSEALAGSKKSTWSWQMPTLALGSTAAIVAVIVSLTLTPAALQPTALEDLSLLSANDGFEFIENVEFYEWLSEEQQNG